MDEHGDLLLEIPIQSAIPDSKPAAVEEEKPSDESKVAAIPKSAHVLTRSRYAIAEIAAAPQGSQVAFSTTSISGRLEHPAEYEIYLLDRQDTGKKTAQQLTHNEALERQLRWSSDAKQLYFGVFAASGNLEGKYRDVQGRLYALDVASGIAQRLGKDFQGSWTDYTVTVDGRVFGLGQVGTEVQPYAIAAISVKIGGNAGTYEGLTGTRGTGAMLFVHSASNEPAELFLATDASHLDSAKQITHLNALFNGKDLPGMKTYRWRSGDGQAVEGVLLYPPGQFEHKHLRMLTLIHGGPADADGNKFGADWYSWAMLAAAKGWLVFEPNYRGSTGYGEEFMLGISPHLVSVPGRDILAAWTRSLRMASRMRSTLQSGGTATAAI